jgi:hypothetical protein
MNRDERRAKAAVERSPAKADSARPHKVTMTPKQEFKRIVRQGKGRKKK